MKRLFTYFILILFLFAAVASAVDKTFTKKSTRKTSDQPTNLDNKKIEDPTDKKSVNKQQKDYNSFVDKNNNGIDDRAEITKRKQTPPPETKQILPPKPKSSPDSTTKSK